MDFKDIIGFAISFGAMAYGFGRQAGEIKNLRRDNDAIANMHRAILSELSDIKQQMARIEQRVIYCEKE